MSLKSGGDATNIAAANTQAGDVDSAGVGVAPAVLGSLGQGLGFGSGISGDATTLQAQNAEGGDVSDNTVISGINIGV